MRKPHGNYTPTPCGNRTAQTGRLTLDALCWLSDTPIVTKLTWGLFAAVVLLLGYASHGAGGLAVVAVILLVPYWGWLLLFPRTRHRSCRGTGEVRSRLYPWAFRKCGGCNGGRQIRHGARVLGSDPVRREHRTAVTGRRTARDQGRWR